MSAGTVKEYYRGKWKAVRPNPEKMVSLSL